MCFRMWWIGTELGQPVAIRSAEFCVVWRQSIWAFALLGSQEGCAYESMGMMYCLYTLVMSSSEWCRMCGRVCLSLFDVVDVFLPCVETKNAVFIQSLS